MSGPHGWLVFKRKQLLYLPVAENSVPGVKAKPCVTDSRKSAKVSIGSGSSIHSHKPAAGLTT